MRQLGGMRGGLLATCAAAALIGSTIGANAGGFHVREQSTEFQGMSFAGNGTTGGGLSGMFWNPAVAAYAPVGIYTESHYAALIGRTEMTAEPGSTLLFVGDKSGDIAKDAIVPSSYLSYRLNDRLVFAMSVNSPFGLVTEPENRVWAGQTFARTSEIKTYNFTPTLAYRLTPTLAFGVGLQIQHIEGRLKRATGVTPNSQNGVVAGDDTAFGFTAGVNWTPVPGTHIGVGYRSSIDHTLEGNVYFAGSVAGLPTGPGGWGAASIKAGVTLPEIVTLSLRQAISSQWTILGTVEWSHWSRLEKLDVVCTGPSNTINLLGCPTTGAGTVQSSLPLGWHDGWFVSLGAEYRYNERLTLRTGFAYEKSPIQAADERSLRVPDADRIWASLGATYKWNEKVAFDFAYTHIFVEDSRIDRTEQGIRFVGHSESAVDILSLGVKVKLGD